MYTLPALQIYYGIYSNIDVPYKFKVPGNDSKGPAVFWDMKLGYRAYSIRRSATCVNDEQRSQLNALGFRFDTIAKIIEMFVVLY